jgi:hypothetical protein
VASRPAKSGKPLGAKLPGWQPRKYFQVIITDSEKFIQKGGGFGGGSPYRFSPYVFPRAAAMLPDMRVTYNFARFAGFVRKYGQNFAVAFFAKNYFCSHKAKN